MESKTKVRSKGKSKAERDELIALYRASDLSPVAFSKEFGIKHSTFYNWLSVARKKPALVKKATKQAFQEVSLPEMTVKKEDHLELLFPSGVILKLSPGTDLKWLANILPVLSRC